MASENFIKMSQICLVAPRFEVFQHMIQGSWFSPMIKRMSMIWEKNDDCATRFDHANPFIQCSNWVRNVFQVLARKREVVVMGSKACQVGRFANEIKPGCFLRVISKRGALGSRSLPNRLSRKYAVISTRHVAIQRKFAFISENTTRAADL